MGGVFLACLSIMCVGVVTAPLPQGKCNSIHTLVAGCSDLYAWHVDI